MGAGWAIAMGPCFGCGRVFGFHPHHVPSFPHPDTGEREPVCGECMAEVNRRRVARGDAPWPIHPDAYEPTPAAEL